MLERKDVLVAATKGDLSPASIAWVLRADKDFWLITQKSKVCPEPDSNRHGLAAEGFSYPLQLSLLSLATHLGSGLSLCRGSVPYNTER